MLPQPMISGSRTATSVVNGIEHDKAPAGEPSSLGDDYAVPTTSGRVDPGGDRVRGVLDRRRRSLGDHGAVTAAGSRVG
jgi:hypothetical protein